MINELKKAYEKKDSEVYEMREQKAQYYRNMKKEQILKFNEEDLIHYFENLYAMQGWYNTGYLVQLMINDNGLETIKKYLVKLLYNEKDIEKEWNEFLGSIKRIGPGMMSELLSYMYPEKYFIINKRIKSFFEDNKLVNGLVYTDKKCDFKHYQMLCNVAKGIEKDIKAKNLLEVDYAIFDSML